MSDQEVCNIVASTTSGDANEAANRVVERTLEMAAKESNMSIEDLKRLPEGNQRRSRHDDTTAVVIYF